ncbi:MAG TPA: hypothetical protein VGF69_19135 [Thermoanaerobaculia bacterium]|jgi:hypothetical protein
MVFAALVAAPLHAQTDEGDINFDPTITDEEFGEFSRIVGQAIYATPVEPARATGLLGFDIGIAVTGVEVDTDSPFWQAAVDNDVTIDNYLAVPRLVVSKGLGAATISGTYARIPDLELELWGGSLDVPIINGGLVKPTLALRGSYSTLQGTDVFECKTYGVEAFLSKGFGPVTPYAAVGRMRVDSEGEIPDVRTLSDQSDINRYTVGVRLSFLIPKFVVEATQAEERSYSAKVSFGW